MIMIAISAHSKHRDAAWELAKYLRNEDADMAWTNPEMGGFPTTLKAIDSPDLKYFGAAEIYRNELEHARPWPAHPKIIAIVRNIIAPYGQKAIVGKLMPQEALDRAAREAQEIIDGKK